MWESWITYVYSYLVGGGTWWLAEVWKPLGKGREVFFYYYFYFYKLCVAEWSPVVVLTEKNKYCLEKKFPTMKTSSESWSKISQEAGSRSRPVQNYADQIQMYKVCSMAEHSIDAVYNYDVSLLTYPNSTQDTVSVCVCVCVFRADQSSWCRSTTTAQWWRWGREQAGARSGSTPRFVVHRSGPA